MRLFNIFGYYIEWHWNLKHWGENIEYVKTDVIIPYYRFYALFIFISNPDLAYRD
jgi:hypothetical protein